MLRLVIQLRDPYQISYVQCRGLETQTQAGTFVLCDINVALSRP
jgi:hypothetical protein